MPSLAEEASAESEHGPPAISGPAYESFLHTLLNQGFGGGFDGAAAEGGSSPFEWRRSSCVVVFPQTGDRLSDFWRRLCRVGTERRDAAEKWA